MIQPRLPLLKLNLAAHWQPLNEHGHPYALAAEFLFRNPTPLDNAPKSTKRQFLAFMIRDNHLLPCIRVAPFLMTTTLRDHGEAVTAEDSDNFVRSQPG